MLDWNCRDYVPDKAKDVENIDFARSTLTTYDWLCQLEIREHWKSFSKVYQAYWVVTDGSGEVRYFLIVPYLSKYIVMALLGTISNAWHWC